MKSFFGILAIFGFTSVAWASGDYACIPIETISSGESFVVKLCDASELNKNPALALELDATTGCFMSGKSRDGKPVNSKYFRQAAFYQAEMDEKLPLCKPGDLDRPN